MKVKVLEAITVGLPVVATPSGAEGFVEDPGIQMATGDRELAAAAAAILGDPGERRERGTAARRLYERAYAPGPATVPLLDLYRRMGG